MKSITLKGSPISTNSCYFHFKPGVRILVAKAKALKEDYMWQAKSQWKGKPIVEDLELKIKLFFNRKGKHDWDNFHKLSMDALTGIVWADDSQIQKATVEKFYDKENPRIEINLSTHDVDNRQQ